MQGDIVAQGIELMLYGMGTVVLFLALLVAATTAMSGIMGRYFPEPESTADTALRRLHGSDKAAPQAQDPKLVVAISAAIHQHRNRQK